MYGYMAKKNISARVPPHVADSIDRYAEAWDMNRTDTLTVLLEHLAENLPEPGEMEGGDGSDPLRLAYTLELESENAEYVEEADADPGTAVNNVLDNHIRLYGND
jgi:hypothetical protein